ncbi:hypothetical protein [Streptomyces sp. Go-475]|nr:hypothetical protein [Streptomyces sp. Go-475]AXE90053.1 hypothetical protein C1703_34000 [Streptomyces sp. Go-475]
MGAVWVGAIGQVPRSMGPTSAPLWVLPGLVEADLGHVFSLA